MPITSPFNARSTAKEVVAGHNLTGKTALITGANCGLGLETARALLSAHAEVIIAIRNITKGESIMQELRGEIPDAQVLEEEACLPSSRPRALPDSLQRVTEGGKPSRYS